MTRLTDEQIAHIEYSTPLIGGEFNRLAFARAIEAAVLAANPGIPDQATTALWRCANCGAVNAKPETSCGAVSAAADHSSPAVADVLRDIEDAIVDSENDRARRYTTTLKYAAALIRELQAEFDKAEEDAKAGWDRAERAEQRVRELEERLEYWATDGAGNRVRIENDSWDGIACRDETIRLLEQRCERIEAELAAVRADAERYRWLRQFPITPTEAYIDTAIARSQGKGEKK